MRTLLDADALSAWAALALEGMRTHRRAIDALNVFPVPDGDTGTNMYLTLEAGVEAMLAVGDDVPEPGSSRLRALARGMLLGARGNSGVIASELLRGVAAARAADLTRPTDGHWLAEALDRAAQAAFNAVTNPKEGTLLTVARAAADAAMDAAENSGGRLPEVAEAAAAAAREALAKTPQQLEALRRAGVVDAGGRGYVVLSDALLEVVSGRHSELPEFARLTPEDESGADPDGPQGYGGPLYEVMHLLDAPDDTVPGLKSVLSRLGDSLLVVGGDGLWNVHVHVDDAGAAIEAAIAAGHPHHIRITYLADVVGGGAHQTAQGRGLVVVVHGAGVEALMAASGVTTVRAPQHGRASTQELLAGVQATGAHEVVLLPSDKDTGSVAESAALAARDNGQRVSVIPTRSIVQSLAAVAVHDPDSDFDDDVIAMTRASSATQYAGLTTAVRDAMTSAGRCSVGDELGVIGGDILEIGSDVREVAIAVLERMLTRSSAELVTVVLGESAPSDLLDHIEDWVNRNQPGVEVVGYEGGQPRWHAIIGVE
jgi:DAK2 domain fusion protein YloV